MREPIRDAKVVGVAGGKVTETMPENVKALLDPGATRTVISSTLARTLQIEIYKSGDEIEGRLVDLGTVELQVLDYNGTCRRRRLTVVVDDEVARRARPGAQMIIGHDYMQKEGLYIGASADPRPAAQIIFCLTEQGDRPETRRRSKPPALAERPRRRRRPA